MSAERPEERKAISDAIGKFNFLTLKYAGYPESQIQGFGVLSEISDARMDELTLKKAAEILGQMLESRVLDGEFLSKTLKFRKLH